MASAAATTLRLLHCLKETMGFNFTNEIKNFLNSFKFLLLGKQKPNLKP